MKKILGIVVLVLLSVSNLNFQSTKAAFIDIFKEPIEVCMDILVSEVDNSESYAARRCKGINKGEVACMKRLIKDDIPPLTSLRRCKKDLKLFENLFD